jgi:hypothetical protein
VHYQQPIVRLPARQLPICFRHRRTVEPYRPERVGEQSLVPTPEILTAAQRYQQLIRRSRDSIGPAHANAINITRTWRNWTKTSSEPEAIFPRRQKREQRVPGLPEDLLWLPETIALTALFTAQPSMLLTLTRTPDAPSPMQFLLSTVRCLSHPAPEQVLRRSHPLFRWAGAPHIARWWWLNTDEPDRTIYAMLSENRSRPAKEQDHWDNLSKSSPN